MDSQQHSKKRTRQEMESSVRDPAAERLFEQRENDQEFEAQEDDDNLYQEEEEDKQNSSEEEGEDLIDNMEKDYERRDELDRYEQEGIDDDQQRELSYGERQRVTAQLNQQDRMRKQGRVPRAFIEDDNQGSDDDEELARQRRMEQMRARRDEEFGDEDQDMEDVLDYEDVKGKVSVWVQKPDVIKYIRKNFDQFLRSFKDEHNVHVYENRIHEMCLANKQSLEVTFNHLSQKNPTIAIWLAEEPNLILPILNVVAFNLVSEVYAEYHKIHNSIFVRVRELPVEDQLRDLRQIHLNALIKIRGVVTKRSGIYPELFQMYFRCQCGVLKGPVYHNNVNEAKQYLGQCSICQSKSYELDDTKTLYRNYQKMTIQETPGTVPPGRVPRQKEVLLQNDLVDSARPGDEVEITGIFINRFDYTGNVKHGFPVFQTVIEANFVRRFGDEEIVELTDEDKMAIKQEAKKPHIAQRIFNSIAPSIYGHQFIKKSLSLCMFGGEAKDIDGKHKIRGDINCLLLGDPGTAKSQFLKYVEQVFHRCVYTTGKGASAVGLTAGVHKDPVSREWTLEGGALVLADKGVCLIDEFDKMNDQDRTSIHEAMEQQSISISKAGIVTSLQARCSVIAAANPIKGNYNQALSFNDNVDLTDPILSRFDILTVIKDEVNEEQDDALATFVINSHMKNHPEVSRYMNVNQEQVEAMGPEGTVQIEQTQEYLKQNLLNDERIRGEGEEAEMLDQDLLKKYIIYARKYVHPKLNEIDKEKVSQFYADIRKESNIVGGIPIAVRHIESVLRMAEAFAKINLRDYVRSDDIDQAIEMLLESFLQSQKLSVARQLAKKFEPYKTKKTDSNQLLLHTLKKMVTERAIYEKILRNIEETEKLEVSIPIDQFENEARDFSHHNVSEFLKSSAFNKDFTIEGRNIRTTTKI